MKPGTPVEKSGWHSGRKHPPVEKVREVKEDKGAHARSVKKQTESNEPGILPSEKR